VAKWPQEGPTLNSHKIEKAKKKKKTPCKGERVEICFSVCGGRLQINNISARQADQQYFGSAGGRRFLVSFEKIKSEGASSSPSETKTRALENYTGS
jgi:hypothetical protein